MHYDVFNGDADGICALHQLRLVEPVPDRQLITGVKRDTALLSRPELAHIKACSLAVFDISIDSNALAIAALLQHNNTLTYFDHHLASKKPVHANFTAHIHNSPNLCTSLIVNDLIKGRHLAWAICGAFGDNLERQARDAATAFTPAETLILREIGELFNYNSYGLTLADLHYHPADLYLEVASCPDPFHLYHHSACIPTLRAALRQDLDLASSIQSNPIGKNRFTMLPDAPWARRISGIFANMQAREMPEAAHCLGTPNGDGTLRISVRSPLAAPHGAESLCRAFTTGGGRPGAAGINSLPTQMLDDFITAFSRVFP